MYTDTGITLETVTVFFHYNSKASQSTCIAFDQTILPSSLPSLPLSLSLSPVILNE